MVVKFSLNIILNPELFIQQIKRCQTDSWNLHPQQEKKKKKDSWYEFFRWQNTAWPTGSLSSSQRQQT